MERSIIGFKKRVAILTILCMMFTLMPMSVSAAANVESDISGHWAEDTIQSWVDEGTIKGYEDGSFKPENTISRAEFMTMVNGIFGHTDVKATTYTDVKSDSWYADAVAKAAAAGYIEGYPDGTMKPDNSISREEAATIIMKINKLTENADAANKFIDASTLVWSKGAVGAVSEANIMTGYPDLSFQPKNYIKRGEAIFALDKSLAFSKSNMDYEDASVMAFETLEGIPENVSVSEYTVNLKDGWMIGGIAEAGSALFYLNLKPADELEYLEKCELVKINLQSGEEVVEYSFEISGTLWVNELMGTKEDLFWVELGKDWKIKRYNLTSKEISTVKSSDDRSQIIMLSSGDRCISWFEDLPEGKMALYVYDIEKDKIKTISEEIMLQFPYTRAPIQDSIVAYVTKPEDSYIVNAYNLKTEELTAQIDVGQEYPGNPAGNQEYLTWCLEPFYGNFDLYAYNIQKGEGIQLNRMEDSTYVFSYDMIGHLILINDRDTNNIICLDMKNGTKANLTAGLGAEHLYYFGQATHNLSYIATEREDNHHKIIKIAILDVTKEAGE